MKIVITGGGTGGHLAIAKALAEEFARHQTSLLYVGSTKGQDRAWFEKSPLFDERIFLPAQGVVDKRGLAKAGALLGILKSAYAILPKIREARAVVSVGGFSAAAASLAAIIAKKPLFVHEQNAHIGSLNRLLKPFAARFFSSFHSPYDPYPVSQKFFDTARKREELRTIIFLGGSQGASAINSFALQIAPKLRQKNISIIHQTGSLEYEKVRRAYEAMGIEADLFAFSDEIEKKMVRADFAISRAGASTAWELASTGLPALFVPYPYAAGDHQYHNAEYFVRSEGALIERQEDLDSQTLQKILEADIGSMSRNMLALAKPGGSAQIVREILSTV